MPKSKNTIYAAGYIRVSTDAQIKGESLSTQKDRIEKYIKAHDYELYNIYEDGGWSGSTTDRPAFQEMLKDAEKEKFQILIINDLSRAARHARGLLETTENLQQIGVSLVSLNEGLDFSGHYGKFLLTMLAAVAELERSVIHERMYENKFARWASGKSFIGSPPYGYKWNKKTKELQIVQKEAKVYKRIVDLYLNQNMSMKDIALVLDRDGTKSRRSKFRSNAISYILRNPVYYGEYPVNRHQYDYDPKTGSHRRSGEMKPASETIYFPAQQIINKATWNRIQKRIQFNKRKNKRSADFLDSYWLRNVLVCDLCGGKVTPHNGAKKKNGEYYRYYACHWAKASPKELETEGREKCSLPRIKAEELELYVWRRLRFRFKLSREKFISDLLKSPKETIKEKKDAKKNLLNKLKRLTVKRDNIYKILDHEEFDKEELARQLQKNRSEIQDVEANITEIDEEINELVELKQNTEFFKKLLEDNEELEQISEELDEMPVKYRKLFVESVSPEIKLKIRKNITGNKPPWIPKDFRVRITESIFRRLVDEGVLPTLKQNLLKTNGTCGLPRQESG